MSAEQADSGSGMIGYVLKRSRRKTLSLIIQPDGTLEVRCPLKLSRSQIDSFIHQKSDWINRKRKDRQDQILIPFPQPTDYRYLSIKTIALAERLITQYSRFNPTCLTIGRQRKRWGSCNAKGQIRLNACLALLPEPLAEYVVIHELCHLVHLNHSDRFHALLQQMLPDAGIRQKALSRYHLTESMKEATLEG